jgi:hypothetical protein
VAGKSKNRNPFYALLVVVGIAFVVSASAFCFMAYSDVMLVDGGPASASRLMQFMDQHGMILLGGEVLLLGLFTIGAICSDEYWQRRAAAQEENESINPVASKDNSHEGDAHHGC